MVKFKNYYRVLDVDDFAEVDEVKSAFRKLARKYHPDVNSGNEERFKEINEAYDVLSNTDKRRSYDDILRISLGLQSQKSKTSRQQASKQYAKSKTANKTKSAKGATGAKPASGAKSSTKKDSGGPASSQSINELFESFIKKNFGDNKQTSKTSSKDDRIFHKHNPKRGEDVTVETSITPLEAEQGVVKTVNVQHKELCSRCSGTGKISGKTCTGCQGEKVSMRLKKIDVRIPAGVKHESKVRVASEGGRGLHGGQNGDLFLRIKIAVDSSLKIDGLDVYSEVPISVTEAVLGADIKVTTINGEVNMTIPELTSSGKVFRLRKMGVKNGNLAGDQFVTVVITMPEKLSAEERKLFESLAKVQKKK